MPLAGLILLSTTLLANGEWVPRMKSRRGLRVLQSHGTHDPLLPFPVAETLRDLLIAEGLDVEWISFRGEHQIPDRVLERMGPFITEVTRA